MTRQPGPVGPTSCGIPDSGRHGRARRAWLVAVALLHVIVLIPVAGCVDNYRQIEPDSTVFSWPATLAADPAGDYVYVVSTNFDSRYTGGTVIPVLVSDPESDGRPVMQTEGSVEIGSFGGEPVVSMLADGRARIWVPIRDGDRLDFADIERDSDNIVSLYCRKDAPEDGAESFHRCGGDYSVKLKQYSFTDEEGDTFFADDAYAVAVGPAVPTRDGGFVNPVYVSGIVGTAVAIFTMDEQGVLTWRNTAPVTEGAHSIMEYPLGASRRVLWVTNRNANQIDRLVVDFDSDGGASVSPLYASSADLLGSSGDYFRSMALSEIRPRLYASFRSPASLTIFDVLSDGSLRYVGLLPLSGSPSGVATWVDPDGREMVYVTESDRDFVYVIDTSVMAVVDTVFTGAAPAGIVVAGDRAFVADFEDSTVSWFDLDPSADSYHVANIVEAAR